MKNGAKTNDYIEQLMTNNCFLHTGIAGADPEAASWAAERGMDSSAGIVHPDGMLIRSNSNTLWVLGECRLIAVFTDGSAMCTSSEWLAHGGWGVHTPGADRNTAGHLAGQPVTSYRAEGRAMVDAVTRAAESICVICDNLAAVRNLEAILACRGAEQTWKHIDECADFLVIIAKHVKENPGPRHESAGSPAI